METIDYTKIPLVKLSLINEVNPSERIQISGSEISYKLLIEIWDRDKIELQEEFKVLLLIGQTD
jgi:hypothetical protein